MYQAFTAIHLGAIVATLWVLLLNGVVGYQLLDDGTPLSLGLLLLSAMALFVGTGYIALDTGFSWTGHFDSSLLAPNRSISLYVLYQLLPLLCLAGFFLLETVLVLRVLGEKKPMRACSLPSTWFLQLLTDNSLSLGCHVIVRDWANFPICHQHSPLQCHPWQNQWRTLRNVLYSPLGRYDMGVLVKHHGR